MGTTLRTSYLPSTDGAYKGLHGAFYERTPIDRDYGATSGNFYSINLAFDASRVSSIYGASNTVRPTSKRATFLIRY